MADLQAKFDEYKSNHGRAPNATQLARFAGCKYSQASSFIKNGSSSASTSTTRTNRSQTVTFTKTSPAFTSSQSRIRTGSFSNDVLYSGNNNQTNTSSSTGIDYSGSTTGANNPWKKFQRKSSNSGSFGQSFGASSSLSSSQRLTYSSKPKPKPKPKPAPKATSTYSQKPASPRQSTTQTTSNNAATASVASLSSSYKIKSPKSTYSNNSSYSSLNRTPRGASKSASNIDVSGLRSDLSKLNTNFERECNKIRNKFEEMRQDLTRKENEIINNLSNYTNQCRGIIEGNIAKLEKLSKNVGPVSANTNNNGYSGSRQISHEAVDSNDYVEIVQDTEEKEPPSPIYKQSQSQFQAKPKVSTTPKKSVISGGSTGIDYSGSLTGANNPWKKKQQASYSTASTTSSYSQSYKSPVRSEIIESNPTEDIPPDPEPEPEPQQQQPAPSQPVSTTTSIKTFIPKPPSATREVESDEWGSESENSW